MRFKDVPIFYTPYLAFPLGDERQSGLLFPSFGHSGNNGYQLEVPYYFNLAPNYDATLTPGYLSAARRAARRRISLPDRRTRAARSRRISCRTTRSSTATAPSCTSPTSPTSRPGLRFDTDIASVSDSNYFSDFAVGADQTSVTFLERRAEFLYYDDIWRIRAQAQNFQTIDTSIDAGRPALFARAAGRGLRAGSVGRRPSNSPCRARSRISCAKWARPACARISRRSCAGTCARPAISSSPSRRLSLHPVRPAERRRRRSEHAHPHAALCERRHRSDLRARRRRAGPAHRRPSSRGSCTATFRTATRTSCRSSTPGCRT